MVAISFCDSGYCVSRSDIECQSWFRSSGFQSAVSPGSRKSCGCVILFRSCLSLVPFSFDDTGRFVSCEFRFQGRLLRVVSLYAPNRNPARDQFLDQVLSWVDPAVPTFVCGDFNTVLDRSHDGVGSVASNTSPFAVHYEKIHNHLRETATNSAKIHSLAQKYERLGINQIE